MNDPNSDREVPSLELAPIRATSPSMEYDANDQATGRATCHGRKFAGRRGRGRVSVASAPASLRISVAAAAHKSSWLPSSGTNDWHGLGLRISAATPSPKPTPSSTTLLGWIRPALIRNQFGASLDGPIRKRSAILFLQLRRPPPRQPESGLLSFLSSNVRDGQLKLQFDNGAGCDASGALQTLLPMHQHAHALERRQLCASSRSCGHRFRHCSPAIRQRPLSRRR